MRCLFVFSVAFFFVFLLSFSDLANSINKNQGVPADFEPMEIVKKWLSKVRGFNRGARARAHAHTRARARVCVCVCVCVDGVVVENPLVALVGWMGRGRSSVRRENQDYGTHAGRGGGRSIRSYVWFYVFYPILPSPRRRPLASISPLSHTSNSACLPPSLHP